MKQLQKVLFTDLDSTLIETKSGRTFPIHSDDWKFILPTLDVIKALYGKGYKVVIVTNQDGIESGFLSEKVFINKIETICKQLETLLKLESNSISYYFCPKMESYNRKPNPGMVALAMEDYELTLRDSIMLGDMGSDKEFAYNAGVRHFVHIDDIRNGYASRV